MLGHPSTNIPFIPRHTVYSSIYRLFLDIPVIGKYYRYLVKVPVRTQRRFNAHTMSSRLVVDVEKTLKQRCVVQLQGQKYQKTVERCKVNYGDIFHKQHVPKLLDWNRYGARHVSINLSIDGSNALWIYSPATDMKVSVNHQLTSL